MARRLFVRAFDVLALPDYCRAVILPGQWVTAGPGMTGAAALAALAAFLDPGRAFAPAADLAPMRAALKALQAAADLAPAPADLPAKTCQNCQFWGAYRRGECDREGGLFSDNPAASFDVVATALDDSGLRAGLVTGPAFSCLHFKAKAARRSAKASP